MKHLFYYIFHLNVDYTRGTSQHSRIEFQKRARLKIFLVLNEKKIYTAHKRTSSKPEIVFNKFK